MVTQEQEKKVQEELQKNINANLTWKDMRILWHSVAPYINSGYGTVTKHFMQGMLKNRMQGFVSAYFGIQPGGIVNWNGIYVLPVMKTPQDQLGFKTAAEHYRRFQCDLGIYHADFWPSLPFAKWIPFSLCYSPLDHENYPDKWLEILRTYKWTAVPSIHAQNELKKSQIPSFFLPHGVDTKVYFPQNREDCRKAFTIDKDKFVIGIVAANSDEEPRKGWDTMFSSIKIFFDNNPEARKNSLVFIHTDPEGEKGRNLPELTRQLGIDRNVIWNDRYVSTVVGLPETIMCRLYNCFDVFFLLSRREGFCIPALEAQACGVPCILNDFSALTERNDYGRCGWLTKPAAMVYSPLNAMTSIPDAYRGADALKEAYESPTKRTMYGKRSLAYAKRQTWEIALNKYYWPMLGEIAESIPRLSHNKELKKIAGSQATQSSNGPSN
jgi:glycosyltransferase involved in cell wall biosynthesis